jgi:hypothetical protein
MMLANMHHEGASEGTYQPEGVDFASSRRARSEGSMDDALEGSRLMCCGHLYMYM